MISSGSKRIVGILLSTLFLLGVGVGCSDLAPDSPLENARRSPDSLARAALAALSERDEEGLADLMVTRDEYETLLWPSLPDRDYMPFDFVWSLTGPRSRKARQEALAELGGTPLELVGVDLGGETEVYEEFTLFKAVRMTVRHPGRGVEEVIPLMDVLVQMGSDWKFLNFGEDS